GENVTGVEQLNFSDVLSHWEGRFHTITLEDRNLPVIANRRVLRPRDAACRAELDDAYEKTAQVRQEILEVLLTREADRAMFKLVYPFSPALIQALVAVSSALQRERTALKIMLQLLVNRRDTLRLGDVIPLGDLWDVVAHGDEALQNMTCLRLAALNHGTIRSRIPGREHQVVTQKLRTWAGMVGEIRVSEEPTNPTVTLQLSGVDTE